LIEVEGDTGPELAAEMAAPGLTVVARGSTADGAARALRDGRLILLGDAGDALGYGQVGGLILAASGAGHRAGLGQRGGTLVVLGPIGRLAGERQDGGRFFAFADRIGPHAGHGHRAGSFLRLAPDAGPAPDPDLGIGPEDAEILRAVLREAAPWIEHSRPLPA
jgi:hypothetical protein